MTAGAYLTGVSSPGFTIDPASTGLTCDPTLQIDQFNQNMAGAARPSSIWRVTPSILASRGCFKVERWPAVLSVSHGQPWTHDAAPLRTPCSAVGPLGLAPHPVGGGIEVDREYKLEEPDNLALQTA